jgi:hypothetical protein
VLIVLTGIHKFHKIAVRKGDSYDPRILKIGQVRNRFKVALRTEGECRLRESELHATSPKNVPALIRAGGRREGHAEFAELDVGAKSTGQSAIREGAPECAEFDVIQPADSDGGAGTEQDKNQAGEFFISRLQERQRTSDAAAGVQAKHNATRRETAIEKTVMDMSSIASEDGLPP